MTLTNSPADILRWLLVYLVQGTDPADADAWPVYVSSEPNQPDNCITVYDTQGQDDGRSMRDGELYAHPGFQVLVRSQDHVAGWQKATAIRTALAMEVLRLTLAVGPSTYLIQCISHIGQVLAIGKDAPSSKRSLFTVNGMVSVEQL